jgi:hypothetical protein
MSGHGTAAIREDAARNDRTNNILYELHTSPVRANNVHGKVIVAAPQGTASCNTNSRAVGHSADTRKKQAAEDYLPHVAGNMSNNITSTQCLTLVNRTI